MLLAACSLKWTWSHRLKVCRNNVNFIWDYKEKWPICIDSASGQKTWKDAEPCYFNKCAQILHIWRVQYLSCKQTSLLILINAPLGSCWANVVVTPFIGSLQNVLDWLLFVEDIWSSSKGVTGHEAVKRSGHWTMICSDRPEDPTYNMGTYRTPLWK